MKKLFILLFLLPLITIAQDDAAIPFPTGHTPATGGSGGGSLHDLQNNPSSPAATEAQSTAVGSTAEKVCPICVLPQDVTLNTPTGATSGTSAPADQPSSSGVKNTK